MKTQRSRTLAVLAWLVALSFVLARPAYAYIDPGSGSTLIQILVAGLLSAGFLIKVYWKRIVAVFRRDKPATPEDEQDE